MSSIIKIPRSFMNLGKLKLGPNLPTVGLVAVGGILLWYLGINPETRKFDLAGMFSGGGLPQLGMGPEPTTPANVPTQIQDMIAQEPYANLDPIEVTDALYPNNAPPPITQAPTPSDLRVETIAAAYNTQSTSVEDRTVIPRKVSGLM